MKVITEAILRDELRSSQPDVYDIPEGKILSPAAREYLQQRKIRIAPAKPSGQSSSRVNTAAAGLSQTPAAPAGQSAPEPRFVDFETGAYYADKPEHMTHLYGNVLVPKDHPRILFRGKLDSLQALVVLDQALILEDCGCRRLVEELADILAVLREIMRCDVLDKEFTNPLIIGLTHEQLREQSHDPVKFFGVKQMVLPDYTQGKSYALLNQLRTAIRETEVAAAQAFRVSDKCAYARKDIIEELNRLSSAIHIMMCKYLAGEYRS